MSNKDITSMTEEELFALSDEEFNSLFQKGNALDGTPSETTEDTEDTEDTSNESENDEEDTGTTPELDEDESEAIQDAEDDENPETDDEAVEDKKSDKESVIEKSKSKSKSKDTQKDKDEAQSDADDEEDTIDYKKRHEDALKPLKANGTEFEPKSIEELRTLAQKGLNYNKKMEAIKPQTRLVQSLKNASISEDDLNLLIDIHKGNKEAIKTIIKKHSLDPYDMSVDNISYNNNSQNLVSTKQVDLDHVVEEINQSEHYDDIVRVINKEWGDSSKQLLFNNPEKLKGLHEEMQLGRFKEINATVMREDFLGTLKKPHLERYIELVTEAHNKAKTAPIETTKPVVKPKVVVDPTVNKKGASPTKQVSKTTVKSTPSAEDLFNMSDDAFKNLRL